MFSAATKDSTNDLREDARALKNDAKITASTAKSFVDKTIEGHNISEFANEAGRKARDYFEQANDQLSDATDKLQNEIKENPLRSGLIALGAGVILGMLLRR